MSSLPPDNQQRLQALDPTRSFIVQAPAGSGKTELLVRRFLVLLAIVNAPEEILAITFTRKATAEMRARILGALGIAGESGGHDSEVRTLAAKVLQNDRRHQWNLTKNPGRLRIQTVDAFAYELVRHMPWSARFGAAPNVIDDIAANRFYLEAAKRALDHISQRDKWSDHCANIIKLADAQLDKSLTLLAAMLNKRDRWMLRGLKIQRREDFEEMWRQVIEQQLTSALISIPTDLKSEIVFLATFAASKPYHKNPNLILASCVEMTQFPAAEAKFLDQWRGIATLLTIKSGAGEYTLRKPRGINILLGFPREFEFEKKRMQSLLETLTQHPQVIQTLSIIPILPNENFSEKQWQSLKSLLLILPLAAAELRLLFQEANQADYVEITQRAKMALGDVDHPSELALSADHQIKHILMDEIQDTSRAQIELLKKLTQEWQPTDGRTLFFVGDPMQSIYRFREAEVGNFLDIKENGIGNIEPESLILKTNFRSNKNLINWFNQVFSEVFPAKPDVVFSAVGYSPSTTINESSDSNVVTLHPMLDTAPRNEAEQIVEAITQELRKNPGVEIGILGRNRNHLIEIAQTLRRKQIHYQGIELESLTARPPIKDLMSLTRALIQPNDRIAWLAILRAPWCGLNLKDLSRLAMNNHANTILELTKNESIINTLSETGRKRLEKLLSALQYPISQRGRVPLRENVLSAWINLGGPTCISQSDNEDCETYFELLNTLDTQVQQMSNPLITPKTLLDAVSRHWSKASSAAQVQLLTIHKAKGLEFDVVIIPRLNSRSRADDRGLLRWTRLPKQLLIAVLPHNDNRDDKFYEYLGLLEKQRQQNELCRLLYVACTRARQKLHLFIPLTLDNNDSPRNPESNSLWKLLWPVLNKEINNKLQKLDRTDDEKIESLPLIKFRRLPMDWETLPPPTDLKSSSIPNKSSETDSKAHREQIEFSWAGETARITGIAIHHMLQNIDANHWQEWTQKQTNSLTSQSAYLLRFYGLREDYMHQGLENMMTAIENLKTDSRAAWIFSNSHTEIRSEWPLTGVIDDNLTTIVIDRGFIDNTGVRWIIDFKSSRHDSTNSEFFLDNEQQRYQAQMSRYAKILELIENNEIKLGLYFPLLKGWREWPHI